MAVPIVVKGATIEPGRPVVLFQTRIAYGGTSNVHQQYDVAPDGRFLINVAKEEATTTYQVTRTAGDLMRRGGG